MGGLVIFCQESRISSHIEPTVRAQWPTYIGGTSNAANTICLYSWDDWVPQDRVRKFTEENKQLAAQLHEQMKALQGKPAPSASKSAKSKGRANGSDFSSARGSEERGSMAAQGGGRAPRRLRDYDLEQVCEFSVFALFTVSTDTFVM